MYQPRLFREDDRARIHDLIEAHSFGALVVVPPGGEPEISHLPLSLDRNAGAHGRLRLHVARANPIWKAALAAGQALAVFTGPHAYVSAGWYEVPTEQVPTWNYAVVHARGTPTEMTGDELARLLDDLVAANEGEGEDAWRTSLLAPGFRDELLPQIVGLSIEITKLDAKFKLSQNRSAVDRARVVDALRARGRTEDLDLVELMSPRTTRG